MGNPPYPTDIPLLQPIKEGDLQIRDYFGVVQSEAILEKTNKQVNQIKTKKDCRPNNPLSTRPYHVYVKE